MGSHLFRLIPLLVVAPMFVSCIAGDAASHNLDVLLDGDDNFRHLASMRTNPRRGMQVAEDEFDNFLPYAVSIGLGTVLLGVDASDGKLDIGGQEGDGDAGLAGVGFIFFGIFGITDMVVDFVYGGLLLLFTSIEEEQLKAVQDPSLEALHQLLYLLDAPHDSLATELRLIRQLSRYAAHCPGRLARERSLLGLGPWLVKLKVESALDPPRVPAEGEDVRALSGRFVDAWAQAPSVGLQDLEAASRDLLDAQLDLRGMWRVLKILETLASRSRATEEMKPVLFDLARTLEGRALGLALGSGLMDRDPLVRAAAMETGMRHLGFGFIQEALESLTPARRDEQGRVQRSRSHGLLPILPGEGLVVRRVLDQLAMGGLRLPDGLEPGVEESVRRQVLSLLIAISYDLVSFDEFARAAALRALSALAPEGPRSRRKEDWEAWWRAFNLKAPDQGAPGSSHE